MRKLRVGGIAANRDRTLRSGAIQRKTPQGAAAAGEEQFTDRNPAAGKLLLHANSETVGPNDSLAYAFVVSLLGAKPGEIYARSQRNGIDAELNRLIHALVGVERLVACVAREGTGDSGEADVAVFGQNQIRSQEIGERGLPVVVAQRKCPGSGRV